MNGIIYCRVSSKEQIEGTSLESQEQACLEYARTKHIGVLKVFIEQGESAKFADRTQLLELIEYCRQNKGKVELLLVWKVDRFARNVGDHFRIKAELLKYGVRVVSVTEPIDTNAEGRLMETILAGFAQFDNDIRAMRTVQGLKRKLQEGIHPWGPPLGYKSSTMNGKKKTKPDLTDPEAFPKLQRAWHEYATGAYSKAEIQRLLSNWGVTTRAGRSMPAQSIDNLFRNPYYAGILVDPWSHEEHTAQHVPMVSREVFARVQQIIAGKNRSTPHIRHRSEFPLRGFARCPSCHHYLTGSFSRGRGGRYAYYHCKNRECPTRTKSVPVAPVLEEFKRLLDNLTPKQGMIDKLRAMILRVAERRERFACDRAKRASDTLAQIEKESQELIQMRAKGLLTDPEFIAQKRVLWDRRLSIEAARDDRHLKANAIHRHLDEITVPITRLYETWEAMSLSLRERFHRLILPVGFVVGQSRTAELGLLFSLIRQSDGWNSTVVPYGGEKWNLIFQEISAFAGILQDYHGAETVSK